MFAQQSLQPKLLRRRYVSVSYALQNNTVFRRAQNWVSVSDGSPADNGSEFQGVGSETAKHLWPYLVVLERGTARSPRVAEQRWPRLADSDTGWAQFSEVCWCCLMQTLVHQDTHFVFNSLLNGQPWSWSRTSVVIWSNFHLRSMTRAAALSTLCRGWTLAALTRWRTLLQ